MAFLHRYNVRLQARRLISIDALNSQHAKNLGEQDVVDMGDSERVKALSSTLTASNVGQEGGQPLNRYDVTVRFRRNIAIDAEDISNADFWANSDQSGWGDTVPNSVQHQGILFMQQNTGVA